VLAPLSDGNVVRRGDILLVETGGGGGHGHPFDRPPDDVIADVEGGFVSTEAAARDYGVVVGDRQATIVLRAKRPDVKAFHRGEYVDVLD
jgi:N-methylhydantoinase B